MPGISPHFLFIGASLSTCWGEYSMVITPMVQYGHHPHGTGEGTEDTNLPKVTWLEPAC